MNDFKLLIRKDLYLLKNNILSILKNPLRLLPYGIMLGYFFSIYILRLKGRNGNSDNEGETMDALEGLDITAVNQIGAVTLLVLVFLIYQLFRATKNNVTFFTMADVNLLFTSPVKPSNILIYYMIRSILPALGGGVIFVLYIGSQMAGSELLSAANLFFMAMGVSLFFFILSPIKFLIFSLNTRYGIIGYFKNGVFVLAFLLLLTVLIPGMMAEKFWQGMFTWIASPWFDAFPLVGWSRAIFGYIFHKNLWLSLGMILAYIFFYWGVVKLVIVHSGYYYEDVLESTQSNEEKKEKVKSKKVSESQFSLNTKKKLDLPDFGHGAKALYWRNYVHSSRQDFHPFFGVYSLGLVAIGVIMSVFSYFEWFSHTVFYFYLLVMLIVYFFAGMSRTNVGDLKKHYFILIPASWPAKFWNMILLDVIQISLFAVFLILPSVMIAGLDWGLILLYPISLLSLYLSGFAISLTTQIGFEEGWDRKLIRPVIIVGVLVFGIFPSVGVGVLLFIVSKQFVYALFGFAVGIFIVAAILLNLTLDIIRKVELKES